MQQLLVRGRELVKALYLKCGEKGMIREMTFNHEVKNEVYPAEEQWLEDVK